MSSNKVLLMSACSVVALVCLFRLMYLNWLDEYEEFRIEGNPYGAVHVRHTKEKIFLIVLFLLSAYLFFWNTRATTTTKKMLKKGRFSIGGVMLYETDETATRDRQRGKQLFKSTAVPRVYRLIRKEMLLRNGHSCCTFCGLHDGCNARRNGRRDYRSWKRNWKTRYRIKSLSESMR